MNKTNSAKMDILINKKNYRWKYKSWENKAIYKIRENKAIYKRQKDKAICKKIENKAIHKK